MGKIKEKLRQIEQSDSFGLFVLFALVISIGLFAFYQDFESLEKREKKVDRYEFITKAKVTDIVPVEHLSMYFDGNKVQTLSFRISYEFNYKNEKFTAMDIIKNRETKRTDWRQIAALQVNDSIEVKVNNKNFGESIIHFSSE